MATIAEPKMKVKVTAKPNQNFNLAATTADISERFSETLKYLAR